MKCKSKNKFFACIIGLLLSINLLFGMDFTIELTKFNTLLNNKTEKDTLKSYWKELKLKIEKAEDYGYDKAIEQSYTLFDTISLTSAYLIHKKGIYYYNKLDYLNAIKKIEKAIQVRIQIDPPPIPDIANGYYVKGLIYSKQYKYREAILEFENSLGFYDILNDTSGIQKCYHRLGNQYMKIDDFDSALKHSKIALLLTNKTENPLGYAKVVQDMAIILTKLKDFDKAILLVKEAVEIYKKLDNSENLLGAYNSIARNYESQKHFAKALIYYKKADQLHIMAKLKVATIKENLGTTYMDLGKHKLANDFFTWSLKIRKDFHKSDYHPIYSNSYHNLAILCQKQKQYKKALNFIQKAIINNTENFRNDSIYANIKINDNIIGTPQSNLEDYKYKVDIFFEWYKESKEKKHLLGAFEASKIFTRLLPKMQTEFLTEESKLFWLNEHYPTIELILEIAFQLHKMPDASNEDKQKYLEFILSIIEDNKAYVLLEKIRKQQNFSPLKNPRYAKLSNNLINLKTQHINERDSLKKQSIQQEINYLEIEKTTVLKELTDKVGISFESIGLNQIRQNLLTPNRALLNYFVGDNAVFLLVITKENLTAHRFSKNSLDQQILQLQRIISSKRSSVVSFQEHSFNFYTHFLEQVIDNLPASINELIVLPDGALSNLPFDVLLTTTSKEESWSPNLPYLLKSHSISYGYSASFLLENKKQRSSITYDKQLVGFAPTFDGLPDSLLQISCLSSLSSLEHNIKEVETICEYYSGSIFTETHATKSNFFDQIETGRILHIASHACINTSKENDGQLFMSDSLIFFHELYELNTNAEMAVLSACETGLGIAKRGEGVFSLSRAFAYSGVPSTTMSLWSVLDYATKEIMTNFYARLSKKQLKHVALKNAKLKYLDEIEYGRYAHPYYWAAFVHYGELASISPQHTDVSTLLFIPLLIAGIFILAFFKKDSTIIEIS